MRYFSHFLQATGHYAIFRDGIFNSHVGLRKEVTGYEPNVGITMKSTEPGKLKERSKKKLKKIRLKRR